MSVSTFFVVYFLIGLVVALAGGYSARKHDDHGDVCSGMVILMFLWPVFALMLLFRLFLLLVATKKR